MKFENSFDIFSKIRAGGIIPRIDCIMEIEVKLYAPLHQEKNSRVSVSLDEPATIDTLLLYLEIDQNQVESIYVNGKEGTFSQSLLSGDRVTLLPLIGGG